MGITISGKILSEIKKDPKIAGYNIQQIKFLSKMLLVVCEDDFSIQRNKLKSVLSINDSTADKILTYFTLNRSKTFSINQFICALCLLAHSKFREKAEQIFQIYDFDNSGVLSCDEMVVLYRCVVCSLIAMTGFKEEPDIEDIEAQVKELLSKYDQNQDGYISLNEFLSIVTKDKKILKVLTNFGIITAIDKRVSYGVSQEDHPQCDSDLENEESKFEEGDYSAQLYKHRVRSGIDFKVNTLQKDGFEYSEIQIVDQEDIIDPRKYMGLQEDEDIKQTEPVSKTDILTAPKIKINLSQVHGYRCHDTRNNIAIGSNDLLVYHTAGVGIIMDSEQQSYPQRYFMQHDEDITCLVACKGLVATGQSGNQPVVYLWDSQYSLSSENRLRGVIRHPLVHGVAHLAFSPEGEHLAVCCSDPDNSIFIFDVNQLEKQRGKPVNLQKSLIASGTGPLTSIFQISINISQRQHKENSSNLVIGLATNRGVYLGEDLNKKITFKLKRASKILKTEESSEEFEDSAPIQIKDPSISHTAILCISNLKYRFVTGSYLGEIEIFSQTESKKRASDTHNGPVMAICPKGNEKGFITGGSDGVIKIWNHDINVTKTFNLLDLNIKNLLSHKIRSIAQTSDSDIIIGTRSGDILRTSKSMKVSRVVRGHYTGRVTGIAQIPGGKGYVTVGEDKQMIVYDGDTRRIRAVVVMQYSLTCVDVSNDSKLIAVGCSNGYVLIYDLASNKRKGFRQTASSNKFTRTIKDRFGSISCLRFSNCNRWLSVGTEKGFINNYSDLITFQRISQIISHRKPVTHIDIEEKGQYMQSMDASFQMVYSKLEDGTPYDKGATFLKDEKWGSWSIPGGTNAMGVWPSCSDGKDITAVAVSNNRQLLAVVDKTGLLKIFRYPCLDPKMAYIKCIAHSGPISGVAFTKNDTALVTIGAEDKAVMEWELVNDVNSQKKNEESVNEKSNQKSILLAKSKGFLEDMGFYQTDKNHLSSYNTLIEQVGKASFKNVNNMVVPRANRRPYTKEMSKMIPAEYQRRQNPQAPNQNLVLEHVFGFRTIGSKNTVKILPDGDHILFPQASLCTVMRLKEQSRPSQRFFKRETGELVSLAVHPSLNIAASGMKSNTSCKQLVEIFVWDIKNLEIISILKGFHQGAVYILRFSPDGSNLLSIGKDADHSLAVYDWANQKLLASSKIDKDYVSDVTFKTNNRLATVGISHIKFWVLEGNNANSKNGNWKGNNEEPLTSIVYMGSQKSYFTGSVSGNIFQWYKKSVSHKFEAHKTCLTVLLVFKPEDQGALGDSYLNQNEENSKFSEEHFYSGGEDGVVKKWLFEDKKVLSVPQKMFSQEDKLKSKLPLGIHSLDIDRNGNLLVATNGSSVYIVANSEERSKMKVLDGHFKGQITGLAIYSSKEASKFVTVGQDQTLRMWNVGGKTMEKMAKLQDEALAVDWAQDRSKIVVALKGGHIELYDSNLERQSGINSDFKSETQQIQDLKICPDSKFIAVVGKGISYIQIFKIEIAEIIFQFNIQSVSSTMLHVDWSKDGTILMVNDEDYNISIYSLTLKSATNLAEAKKQEWNTWTCHLGWPVQGIYTSQDENDVLAVTRTVQVQDFEDNLGENTGKKAFMKQDIVATGDKFSKIRIFNFPSLSNDSNYKEYSGHSGEIGSLKFNFTNSHLISVGKFDQSIMIWKTDFNEVNMKKPLKNPRGSVRGDEFSMEKIDNFSKKQLQDIARVNADFDEAELALMNKTVALRDKEIRGEVTEQLKDFEKLKKSQKKEIIKNWQINIRLPKSFVKPSLNAYEPPEARISLEHVFGFRTKDVRGNFKLVKNHAVFFTAGVVVSQSLKDKSQKFFTSHRYQISCIAVNQDQTLIASGEVGPNPQIFIWNPSTMQQSLKIQEGLVKGVVSLNFSPNSKYLLAVCIDDDHRILVYSAVNGVLLHWVRGDRFKIYDSVWTSDKEFVTVGLGHYKTWKISRSSLTDIRGLLDKVHRKTSSGGKPKIDKKIICCAYDSTIIKTNLFTGTQEGKIQIWQNGKCIEQLDHHSSCVDTIVLTDKYIISGSKDRQMIFTSYKFVNKYSINLGTCIGAGFLETRIRSLDISRDSKTILVGTASSDLFKLTFKSKDNSNIRYDSECILRAHYAPSVNKNCMVYGVASLSDGDRFLTCSEDFTLRMWSISQKKMLGLVILDQNQAQEDENDTTNVNSGYGRGDLSDRQRPRALAVSPDDREVAVGCKDGALIILSIPNLKFQENDNLERNKSISVMKYSPDGKYLAVGSEEAIIDILSVPGYKTKYRMKNHSFPITQFDFTIDSNYLQSTCREQELLYWSIEKGEQLLDGARELKDKKWKTWNCPLGWPVQGIWKDYYEGNDINKVERSESGVSGDQKYVATGDRYGQVRLYKYPCMGTQSKYVVGLGHNSEVTNLAWVGGDRYIVSTGGDDQTVMVWKIEGEQQFWNFGWLKVIKFNVYIF